jgi:hypothetical protein
MEKLKQKAEEMYLMTKVNSLVDNSTGERLVVFSLNDLIYVNEKISKTEYEDLRVFIKKLLEGLPLLCSGSEGKEELSEEDFIYY